MYKRKSPVIPPTTKRCAQSAPLRCTPATQTAGFYVVGKWEVYTPTWMESIARKQGSNRQSKLFWKIEGQPKISKNFKYARIEDNDTEIEDEILSVTESEESAGNEYSNSIDALEEGKNDVRNSTCSVNDKVINWEPTFLGEGEYTSRNHLKSVSRVNR